MTDSTADQPGTTEDDDFERKQGLLDRFRGTGVGVEDPHIVGDTGATDVAPGGDPDPDAVGRPPAADDAGDPDHPPGRDVDTPPPGA